MNAIYTGQVGSECVLSNLQTMERAGGVPIKPGLLWGKPNATDDASYEPIVQLAYQMSWIFV